MERFLNRKSLLKYKIFGCMIELKGGKIYVLILFIRYGYCEIVLLFRLGLENFWRLSVIVNRGY